MRTTRLLALALALALAAGCSSAPRRSGDRAGGVEPTSSGSASASASATATASATAGKPTSKASPKKSANPYDEHAGEDHLGGKYSPDELPPATFRNADSGEQATGSGKIRLQLKIEPNCVEPGDRLAVTIKTKPDVQVGLLTNLPANEKGQGQEKRGRSTSDGTYTWWIQVLARTAPANYNMFAAAADDKGYDGGRSGNWLFVVAPPGGCD